MAQALTAAILSGGKSTRMGQDKALLKINNERFLDRLSREFSSFDELLLSVANPGDYADAGLKRVVDEYKEIGPIEGIRQALLHAANDYVFVCAVDMPFLKKELALYLQEFLSSDVDAVVLSDEDRVHPLCAIYSKKVLPVIEELIAAGKYRLLDILGRVRCKYVKLEHSCFEKKLVKNINTRDEYRAEKLPVVFCVSGIKNSGKTFLIERLISEFIADGRTVGVIKYDGHDFSCDVEGADSDRICRAGAQAVALYSEYQSFVHWRRKLSLEEMIEGMHGLDVVILEGQKASAYPSVEVLGKEVSEAPVCDPQSLICIASDHPIPGKTICPVFDPDDVPGVFSCIKSRLFDA